MNFTAFIGMIARRNRASLNFFKMEVVSQENGKLIKGELGHIFGRVRKLRSL